MLLFFTALSVLISLGSMAMKNALPGGRAFFIIGMEEIVLWL